MVWLFGEGQSQLTFASATSVERFRKPTRRDVFRAEMQRVVPWMELCAVIDPVYPQPEGAGRRPVGIERMLRIYFLQQWFNLSDPAWKRLCTTRWPCAAS